jgi:hypothetical protein
MSPNELADMIEAMIQHIRKRIEGVGAKEYDKGDKQHIETLSHKDLTINAVEEIDDALVYLAYLRLRLTALVFEHDHE